jgi:hypothetical protein
VGINIAGRVPHAEAVLVEVALNTRVTPQAEILNMSSPTARGTRSRGKLGVWNSLLTKPLPADVNMFLSNRDQLALLFQNHIRRYQTLV